jgi:hypothetical protein
MRPQFQQGFYDAVVTYLRSRDAEAFHTTLADAMRHQAHPSRHPSRMPAAGHGVSELSALLFRLDHHPDLPAKLVSSCNHDEAQKYMSTARLKRSLQDLNSLWGEGCTTYLH